MAEDSDQIGQDEIEQLLRQAQDSGGASAADQGPKEPANEDDSASLDQNEIERLMAQGTSNMPVQEAATPAPPAMATAAPAPVPAPPSPTPAQAAVGASVTQNDVELLLNKAEQALASIDQTDAMLPEGVKSFQFQDFSGTTANTKTATLELMRDVQFELTIELGRTHMHLEEVLNLAQGAVVPLDKLAGDPADIYVNGRLVARGEILVLNDNFCVRVAELVVGESACA
jgi:flagellar motor switch protein FliN